MCRHKNESAKPALLDALVLENRYKYLPSSLSSHIIFSKQLCIYILIQEGPSVPTMSDLSRLVSDCVFNKNYCKKAILIGKTINFQ